MAVTFNGQLEINTGQGVKADAPTLRAPKRATPIPKLTEDGQIEQEQGITLRVGLFFDGTGNNLPNAVPPNCTLDYDPQIHKGPAYQCDDSPVNNDREGSYENSASNVARLFELYQDDSLKKVKEGETAHIPVYIEGMGTKAGEDDYMVFGQAMGAGETGVKERVAQSPEILLEQLNRFFSKNPDLKIKRIEFDVFGFSRGSAAARHCVNEILKDKNNIFAEQIWNDKPDKFAPGFSGIYGQQIQVNFVGLYDSVAAIVGLLEDVDTAMLAVSPATALRQGDYSTSNSRNPGVLQYLPPEKINKVIHIRSLDESREGFALNQVVPGHHEVMLPGVHSDIGGGYLREEQESHWLTELRSCTTTSFNDKQKTQAYQQAQQDLEDWKRHHPYLANHPGLRIKSWSETPNSGSGYWTGGLSRRVNAVPVLERTVRGELSLIYLHIMRQVAVEYGVPFEAISQAKYSLPRELKPLYPKLLAQARDGRDRLSDEEKRWLYPRYVHISAHWDFLELDWDLINSTIPISVMKPANNYQRIVHPHELD